MDIGAWLRRLGLEHYETAFRENKIDGAILPRLTAEDLKDLGVALVGDRRRLLEAITALREENTTTPETSAAPPRPQPEASEPAIMTKSAPPPLDGGAEIRRVTLVGERRHLTVMFCDLVGSTQIAARIDAEEWRDIVAEYHRAVTGAVNRFGGHVAKNLGDGALVYFGYPHAQENDADVHCAPAWLSSMRSRRRAAP